jgi:hypothetical protein
MAECAPICAVQMWVDLQTPIGELALMRYTMLSHVTNIVPISTVAEIQSYG